MKKKLIVFGLVFCLVGCSGSPLDRLKNYKPDPNKPDTTEMSSSDINYWIDSAEKDAKDFKEASDFCEGPGNGSERCEVIYKLSSDCEMDKIYEPGKWLSEARAVKKERCDDIKLHYP